MAVSHLECKECKAEYPLEALYVCEKCFGPLEVAYDHSRWTGDVGEARRRIQGGPQNIWRYAEFLPLAGGPPGPSGRLASRVGLPAGCTPLIRADRLAARLGLREVWVKNDAANPTHSFKDRVVSVAVTRAREQAAARGRAQGLETGWTVFSYLLAGMAAYGAIGWLIGRAVHVPLLFPLGMLLGLGISIGYIIHRFGRQQQVERPRKEITGDR